MSERNPYFLEGDPQVDQGEDLETEYPFTRPPEITAMSRDESYEAWFGRQVEIIVKYYFKPEEQDDVRAYLIAIMSEEPKTQEPGTNARAVAFSTKADLERLCVLLSAIRKERGLFRITGENAQSAMFLINIGLESKPEIPAYLEAMGLVGELSLAVRNILEYALAKGNLETEKAVFDRITREVVRRREAIADVMREALRAQITSLAPAGLPN